MNDAPRIRLDSRTPGAAWTCRPGEPMLVLECEATTRQALLRNQHGIVRMWDDPLAALDWMPQHLEEIESPTARWIGYLGYDLGRWFETLPARTVDDLQMPLFAFTLHHVPVDLPWGARPYEPSEGRGALDSNFTRERYVEAVEKAIDYIAAGDVFQVNLSQRFSTPLTEHPSQIYDRLRRQSPAQYGAYLDHLDYALICNSPELFLRVERDALGRRHVATRPIKGTRPRQTGMELQLRDSEKDAAELNMIIDLERNDLGRVCETGTVSVSEPRTIEAHPTVYHGVATVEGVLREDVGLVDLLRATFPGGSITGAPKIRSMEIIEELEPTRRGPYCGAIGYLAPGGRMEFNIAIRTMIVRDGLVHISVGGGIVADSDPIAEYDETLVKAQALFAALGIAPEAVARLG